MGAILPQTVNDRPGGPAGPEHHYVLPPQRGRFLQRLHRADPVGIVARQDAIAVGHGVDRADLSRDRVHLIQIRHHRLLVRHRDRRAHELQAAHGRDSAGNVIGRDRQKNEVQSQRREPGVVHRWSEIVLLRRQ